MIKATKERDICPCLVRGQRQQDQGVARSQSLHPGASQEIPGPHSRLREAGPQAGAAHLGRTPEPGQPQKHRTSCLHGLGTLGSGMPFRGSLHFGRLQKPSLFCGILSGACSIMGKPRRKRNSQENTWKKT